MEQLEQQLSQAGYRVGDVCEVAVISAHDLPGNSSLETTIMVALDTRHQVQQTRSISGNSLVFEEDFVAKISKDNKLLTCAIYQSEPGRAGELVGNCHVKISDIDIAPGSEIHLPIFSQDDPTVPITANEQQSGLKLFLARSNPSRSARKPRDDQVKEKGVYISKLCNHTSYTCCNTYARLKSERKLYLLLFIIIIIYP